MRVVLDTNILVSALLDADGLQPRSTAHGRRVFHAPDRTEQLDELRATLHKPAIAARIKPYKAGRLVNQMKELAENIGSLPRVKRSQSTDDFLLALSKLGRPIIW
jgi:predicted nucleic acid-binding protein